MTGRLSRRAFLRTSGMVVAGAVPLAKILAANSPAPLSSETGTKNRIHEIRREAFTMGSIVTLRAFCNDAMHADKAIDRAFREMKEIDTLMSVYNDQSQISRLNHNGYRTEMNVDPRIIEILGHSQFYNGCTGGAFDITIEPLMELYGFRDDESVHHYPTDRQIAAAIESVGTKNINVNNRAKTVALLHADTRLDLGGIAVGYALDRAVNVLRENGITSAIINHSGDIFGIGAPPEQDAWEVGIVDPLHPDSMITTVRIKDQALSTSGNYENTIVSDGRTIGHILDPKSAKTADGFLSTTIIANSALAADALSTGTFVIGRANISGALQNFPGTTGIGIIKSGNGEEIIDLT